MKRTSRSISAVAVTMALVTTLTIPLAAPAAAQTDDSASIVIAAGNVGREYNISSGSQLSPTRSLLLDSAEFGPGGTVDGPTITIKEDDTSIDSSYLADADILFDGWDRSSNWSGRERQTIDEWVRAGGVLISTNDDPDWDGLGELFGLPTEARTSGNYSAASSTHPVVSGPFGSWTSIQTAGWVSYFGDAAGWTVIASDGSGRPAIVERAFGSGHVILMADEGPLRSNFGGANRIMAGNLFAHAITLADIDVPVVPDPTPTPAPTATSVPTVAPTATTAPSPTAEPTVEPTTAPTAVPEPTATPEPTAAPPTATPEPTTKPSDEASLELVSDTLASMVAGDDAWVVLTWRGLAAVTDLEVTLSNDAGVTVAYPTNTGDHSGPSQDSALDIGETDYTAFFLGVPDGTAGSVGMTANVTWTAFGAEHVAAIPVQLPVVQHTGQDVEVLTTSAQVENGWIAVHYRGLAPVVTDFRLRVTDAADGTIEYPRGGFTSLYHDDELEDGETDLARFFVDDSVSSGDVLVLETSYDRNGENFTVEHEVSVQ